MRLTRTMIATAAVGGLVALAGCTAAESPTESATPSADSGSGDVVRGGELRIGIGDDVTSWDTTAINVGNAFTAYQAAYDSLMRVDESGAIVPSLATSWEYDDAQTALTLELQSGVTFSDGTPFDGEAVKANLEYFAAGAGPLTSQLSELDTVEVVDEDTVIVHLTDVDPAFETYLAGGAGFMASPAAIEAGTLAQTPVGTGPYVLDENASVAGSQYVFTARDGYWAPELQMWDSVEYRYLEDDTAQVNALISGQIDATDIEPSSYDQVSSAGFEVLFSATDWEGLILFDRDGAVVPALADARVRQAINYAIDRDVLNTSLQNGNAEITNQIFGPDSGSYVDSLDGTYGFDPEMARQLLADAGYADGFEMHVPVPGPIAGTWALIGQMLADVGITVVQDNVAFPDYRGVIAAGQYPAALFRFTTGDPWGITIRNYILTDAGVWNPFGSSTDELDGLLDEVRMAGADYRESAKAVNEYVVDEAWFVPFFRNVQNYVYNADTVSVVVQPGTTIPALYNFAPAAS